MSETCQINQKCEKLDQKAAMGKSICIIFFATPFKFTITSKSLTFQKLQKFQKFQKFQKIQKFQKCSSFFPGPNQKVSIGAQGPFSLVRIYICFSMFLLDVTCIRLSHFSKDFIRFQFALQNA